MKNEREIKWKTNTKDIDIETGEEIKRYELNNYILIKTQKHATVRNVNGIIDLTREWRKIYNGSLFKTQ